MPDAYKTIFPARSHIDQLEGEQVTYPTERPEVAARALRRIAPLLKARQEVNETYQDGSYFFRHYPKADKELKRLLHRRVMGAWSNALNDDDFESAPGLGGGPAIVINVGR